MDKTMLTLKPGVTLTERDGQTGLTLQGRTKFVKDARQAEILRALVDWAQPVESLMVLLRARDGPTESGSKISLDLAEFILDFGDYLED